MRAVILAGGKGTRLRPYTTVLPKPLVPVGERPILELIIRQLAAAGFDSVDFCVGHLGELIKAYFEQGPGALDGMRINYIWEDEPLGTAGALRLLDPPTDDFLVMNGDILTDLDYGEVVRYHREREAAMTIATYRKSVSLALGVIEGEGGSVTGFIEKPTLNYEVSMGIYIYSPRALAMIPPGRFDFPDLVHRLLESGETVAAYHFDGAWFDIGTRDEHEHAVIAYEDAPQRFEPADA